MISSVVGMIWSPEDRPGHGPSLHEAAGSFYVKNTLLFAVFLRPTELLSPLSAIRRKVTSEGIM